MVDSSLTHTVPLGQLGLRTLGLQMNLYKNFCYPGITAKYLSDEYCVRSSHSINNSLEIKDEWVHFKNLYVCLSILTEWYTTFRTDYTQ